MKQINKKTFSSITALMILAPLLAIPQMAHRKRNKTITLHSKGALHTLKHDPVVSEKKRGDELELTLRSPIDGFHLSATLYPQENPKGIVQIIHSIHEHKGRYRDFARFLHSHGYAIIVSDSRGHGKSVDRQYPRNYMGDFAILREDQYMISNVIKKRYSGIPLYLFSHSLGSLIARAYIQEYDDNIDKLILSATVMHYPPVYPALPIVRIYDFYARLIRNILPGPWISRGEKEILSKMEADPEYLQAFHPKELITVLELNQVLEDINAYKKRQLSLPILSISGEHDYLVAGGRGGISRSMNILSQVGYKNMISIVYSDMSHDIFKDPKKEFVYKDILSFIGANET